MSSGLLTVILLSVGKKKGKEEEDEEEEETALKTLFYSSPNILLVEVSYAFGPAGYMSQYSYCCHWQ